MQQALASFAAFWSIYLLVVWFTFPSDAVISRLRHELREATNEEMDLRLDSVSPWRAGLWGTRLVVNRMEADGAMPVFFADAVGVRVAPLSALRRAPHITGQVRFATGGTVNATVQGTLDAGAFDLRMIDAQAEGLDVEDLLAIAGQPGAGLVGSLDVGVDLVTDEGMSRAAGEVSLRGRDMTLEKLSIPTVGLEDLEINLSIEELDVLLDGRDGKLDLRRGALRSSLADIDIEGHVELADALPRSRVQLSIVLRLGDWSGSPLESFRSIVEGFLSSAKWADGSYHYSVNSTVGRFNIADLRPERDGSSRSRAASTPSTRPRAGSPDREDRLEAARARRDAMMRPERPAREPEPRKRALDTDLTEDDLEEELLEAELEAEGLEGELEDELEDEVLDEGL